jgi:hypothetical protein
VFYVLCPVFGVYLCLTHFLATSARKRILVANSPNKMEAIIGIIFQSSVLDGFQENPPKVKSQGSKSS